MNMSFLPWSENASPETDEDDAGRRFYEREIKKLHKRAKAEVPSESKYYHVSYLCKRVSLIAHLVLCLQRRNISKKDYIELSQKLNIDIILELNKRNLIDHDGW